MEQRLLKEAAAMRYDEPLSNNNDLHGGYLFTKTRKLLVTKTNDTNTANDNMEGTQSRVKLVGTNCGMRVNMHSMHSAISALGSNRV